MGTAWTETLVLNASSVSPGYDLHHVAIDGCNRYWLSMESFGVNIFDDQGLLLGTLQPTNSFTFDALILADSVIYLSDSASNRIIRIDPKLQC